MQVIFAVAAVPRSAEFYAQAFGRPRNPVLAVAQGEPTADPTARSR